MPDRPAILRTLRSRVIAVVVAFGLVVSAVLAFAVHLAHDSYSLELRRARATHFLDSVTSMYGDLLPLARLDRAQLEARFRRLVLSDPSTRLYLLDSRGRILAGSHQPAPVGDFVRTAPLLRALREPSDGALRADDPDEPGRLARFAVSPIAEDGRIAGYLYLVLGDGQAAAAEAAGLGYAKRTATLVGAGALGSGLILSVVILAIITLPLKRLTGLIESLRSRGFEASSGPQGLPRWGERNDEIGRLSRAFTDLYDRLKAQHDQLRALDAARREWIAAVSHDLRTPLTSLIGHLETLLLHAERVAPSERRSYLAVALENARQLNRLSTALLDLARLEDERFVLTNELIAPGELLDDIARRFRKDARDQGIVIEAQYPERLPLVEGDSALLERAIGNLVDNAIRFSPAKATIAINASATDGRVVISIADEGPGVDPQDLPRLFDRFFQAKAHREGRGHCGLGLAIVKRVCELHGGHVVAANRDGHGAIFELILPARGRAASPLALRLEHPRESLAG